MRVRRLLYSVDRHSPPSFSAASCIFASVSRSPLGLFNAFSPFGGITFTLKESIGTALTLPIASFGQPDRRVEKQAKQQTMRPLRLAPSCVYAQYLV